MRPSILFILHLPPPVHGAATVGKYIQESSIINNEFNADFINLSTSTGLTETGKGGIKKITILFKIQTRVLKALFNKNYDLCYMTLTTSGPGFYKDLFVVFFLKLFNRKIIYHFHNKGIASAAKNKLNHHLYRFALKKTQCILISQNLYPDVKHYINKNNVFYCANGIPSYPKAYLNKIEISKIEGKGPCHLLFLSNMMVEKGVFTLLDVCKQLKAKGFSFECHFVGAWSDISQEMFTDAILKDNLSDVVFAHGPKYNQEKFPFFNNADIFIFPTYCKNEVFPLVILEAIQFGLPVISTEEGGIRDIIIDGETGFRKLLEKVEILIRSPKLRLQMGIAGTKKFKDLYTLEKFETNLVNILKIATAKV